MKLFKTAWDNVGWIVGIYTVYKQLQSINEMKNDVYAQLSPSEQSQWDRIFGKPGGLQNPFPTAPVVTTGVVTSKTASPITQIKAGT